MSRVSPLSARYARRSRRSNAQMNVVPYIDVMLVLLVIFMVVAPMIQTKVLNLPSVAKATAAQEPPLIVEMDAQGMLKMGNANNAQQFTDTAQLIGALQQSLRSKPQPVVLAADKAVAYGDVMRVMDALKSAQIERVGLLLKQSDAAKAASQKTLPRKTIQRKSTPEILKYLPAFCLWGLCWYSVFSSGSARREARATSRRAARVVLRNRIRVRLSIRSLRRIRRKTGRFRSCSRT